MWCALDTPLYASPQILPCPLKGACTGGRRTVGGLSPEALLLVQQQALGMTGAQQSEALPRPRHRPDAWDWENNQRRRLLQSAAAVPAEEVADGAEGYAPGGSVQQRSSAPHLAELQDGVEGWDGVGHHAQQQQAQVQELVVSRRQALMGYNRLLAQLWANDSADGIPLLAGIEYTNLLDSWHRLQCNPG